MSGARPRYVVTGASGWIGQAVLHRLRRRLGPGWGERVALFGAAGRPVPAPGGPRLQRALSSLQPRDVEGARVLHLAFLGRERAGGNPAAFRAANRAIDAALATALRQAPAAGLFVASSGAARLAASGADPHPYGLAKLEQEALFAELARESGTPTLVGRVHTLAGPYMNKLQAYALSSFLLQARGGAIRIEAGTPVLRSYLHVLDLAELVLGALDRGEDQDGPRDLCGMAAVEMADVALAAARASGLKPSAIRRGPLDLSRPSAYLGDPVFTRTLALAQGLALRPFAAQVRDTARWLAQAVPPAS